MHKRGSTAPKWQESYNYNSTVRGPECCSIQQYLMKVSILCPLSVGVLINGVLTPY